jgi:hypothetical protein
MMVCCKTRKFGLHLICLAVIVCSLFYSTIYAEILVGVEEGYWMEYNIFTTGDVPPGHDVNGAKIEILSVAETKIDIQITSKYSDGTEEIITSTLNLETGQIGDSFIIPANLNAGDTFLEQNEGTLTISGVEEKIYAGAKRTTVYTATSITSFHWDRSTGFLVEATSTYPEFTLTTKAENTNIWQNQTFGIDPIIPIVLVAAIIGAVLAIVLTKIKK